MSTLRSRYFYILLLQLINRFFFFFFNDTATTEIYTLSLHDALPISSRYPSEPDQAEDSQPAERPHRSWRSEEHTSELQSQSNLVCRLLLEKKKKTMPCSAISTPRLRKSTSRSHDTKRRLYGLQAIWP